MSDVKIVFHPETGNVLKTEAGNLYLKKCDKFVFLRDSDRSVFESTTGVLEILRELYTGISRESLYQKMYDKIEEAFDGNQSILKEIDDDCLSNYMNTLFDWYCSSKIFIKNTPENLSYIMEDICLTLSKENILVIMKNKTTLASDNINIFKLLHDANYGAVQCIEVVVGELARSSDACNKLLLRPDLIEEFANLLSRRTIEVYPKEEVNEVVEEIAKIKCDNPVEIKDIAGYGIAMVINGRAIIYNCNNDSYKAIDLNDGSLLMESKNNMTKELNKRESNETVMKEYFEDTFKHSGESLAKIVSEHPDQIRFLLEMHDSERNTAKGFNKDHEGDVIQENIDMIGSSTGKVSNPASKDTSSSKSSVKNNSKRKKGFFARIIEPILEALVRED